jgi:hypothetical protein
MKCFECAGSGLRYRHRQVALRLALWLALLPSAPALAESVDELFDLESDPPAAETEPTPPAASEDSADATAPAADAVPADSEAAAASSEPDSLNELFGEDVAPAPQEASAASRFFGFYQSEFAYTYAEPGHVQQFRQVLEVGSKGQFSPQVRWYASVRLNFDPTYGSNDFYPERVVNDQDAEVMARETYLDIGRGDFEFRLGRQHIIWGEMVGLFFADVVSARDLRQFVLPDFDTLRMPQWAARAEYFKGNFHAEAVWIPFMTYDDIGEPGAEYFPFRPTVPAPFGTVIRSDQRPDNEIEQGGYGLRANYLAGGWDGAVFLYSAPSLSPAFGRSISLLPTPVITFTPERQREYQLGGTLAKELDFAIFKTEVIYTRDRLFESADPAETDGLVAQDLVDYVAALEFSFAEDTRFTVQGFQRQYLNHDTGIIPDRIESGFTLLLSTRALHPDLEPEILYVSSLNRKDSMFQAKLSWDAAQNVRLVSGVDIFEGRPTGIFGRYDSTDRAYIEGRYSF